MTPDQRMQSLAPLCAGVPDSILRDFVSRMDAEYFDLIPRQEVARHVALAARLDPEHPSQVILTDRDKGLLDVTVVAYDYFSEFATVCGLLSAFGLDIREGSIYTFGDAPATTTPRVAYGSVRRRPRGPAGLSRKKIVDLFRVSPLPGVTFGADLRRRFATELEALIRLLEANRFQDARNRVNRKLVEALGRSRALFTGLLQPVQISFDNLRSARNTVMDIRSADTPAFLYAFANALAMRGLYIDKARFENLDGQVRDRFFVRGRHGHKLETPAEQQELRLTAVLIKQFTQFLGSAPDPAKALKHFDLFLDQMLDQARGGRALKLLTDKRTLASLARLFGTSDFLWEDFLRRQHGNLLPVLQEYQRRPLIRSRSALAKELRQRLTRITGEEHRRKVLNQFKDREMFRIDMRHLLDPSTTLPDFSRALTQLAEVVLDQTVHECQAKFARRYGVPRLDTTAACPFAVFGLGKFGGRELGYASDIEVLFVYGGGGRTSGRRSLDNSEFFERLSQEVLQWIEAKQEGIFHLDVRLRPHGAKGLLASTFDELQKYYRPGGFSAPFERQALIKLRFVAGDSDLGGRVEAFRDAFVYSREPWNLETALDLRRQQIKELTDPGQINVKLSPGGLIDVEYAVQYLQLLHGHTHAALRTPNTLRALEALAEAGHLEPGDTRQLREAYLFFRHLIDGLRMVRGNARDLVLPSPDSDAFVFLARRIGYTAEDWKEGAARLAADTRRHMQCVREFFDHTFGRLPRGAVHSAEAPHLRG